MRSCHSGMMRAYKAVLLLKVILEISCLLRLLFESGDMVLKEHLCSAPNNAKYQTPTIQNDLFNATGEWIQEKVYTK